MYRTFKTSALDVAFLAAHLFFPPNLSLRACLIPLYTNYSQTKSVTKTTKFAYLLPTSANRDNRHQKCCIWSYLTFTLIINSPANCWWCNWQWLSFIVFSQVFVAPLPITVRNVIPHMHRIMAEISNLWNQPRRQHIVCMHIHIVQGLHVCILRLRDHFQISFVCFGHR